MRHGDKINNLGRTASHRKALLSNLACSLIEHKRIFTTLAKAKALRTYVEPIINKSKDDSTHSRRTVFSYLKSKEIVSLLYKEVSVKVAERNGGYTRIIKTGNRQGDAAEMALIELVDFNEIYSNKKATKVEKAKTTRRGRSAKKTTTDNAENSVIEESPES
ncbi:MAG: 50S ribosomal protein L17 [Bacteroidota bacterium]|jgi:large subunit ribosomal protein L17